MTDEREIWTMALWVEQNHAYDGATYIAEQIIRNEAMGAVAGVALWRAVAERFRKLREDGGAPS
jgi:hypothetical protein